MCRFNVTFETINNGDAETRGYAAQGVTLREALHVLGYGVEGIEANESWVTAYRTNEDFATGETENRSLHFPDEMTVSSRLRVCRMLGAIQ